MTDKKGPGDHEGTDLKSLGRSAADELQARYRSEGGDEFAWFDALYERANGRRGFIPWSDAAPRFKLKDWLADKSAEGRVYSGMRALDVGCGLGDNARCLAQAGLDVTAFDISEHAVAWARKNAGDEGITFEVADILDLPARWCGAFDLVHETYNLQAMPPDYVVPAMRAIASLVAPKGTLLVMTRGRLAHEEVTGPPRPLTKQKLEVFELVGLELVKFEEFFSEGEYSIKHFLAEYVRHAI